MRNGDLLDKAEGTFDLFITADQNLRYQQRLAGRRIAVLELSTNDLRRILAAEEAIRAAIETLRAGVLHGLEIP
jgi:hypothetical protein